MFIRFSEASTDEMLLLHEKIVDWRKINRLLIVHGIDQHVRKTRNGNVVKRTTWNNWNSSVRPGAELNSKYVVAILLGNMLLLKNPNDVQLSSLSILRNSRWRQLNAGSFLELTGLWGWSMLTHNKQIWVCLLIVSCTLFALYKNKDIFSFYRNYPKQIYKMIPFLSSRCPYQLQVTWSFCDIGVLHAVYFFG